VLLATILSGCATPREQLGASVTQSISAVQTARLAITLNEHGASTFAITSTALTDALSQLTDAAHAATELDLSGGRDSSARQATLALIRQSTDAVNAAREAMNERRSLYEARTRLGELAETLTAEARRLGVPG